MIGSPPKAIDVAGLVVYRGDSLAVDGVDLEIEPGIITSIVGPSGCGKTSLLRAIAGFERPAAGSIAIDGESVVGPDRWVPPERRRVGMVFQEGALFPHLSVAENVRYGIRGGPESRVAEVLGLVGLAELGHRMPHELSGGQQQRVAVARALAPSPRVILLDEPFVNLDATLRERVREDVRQILDRAGITTVLVTHDQEEALSVARRVAVMDAGRILQVDAPEDIYLRPESARVAEFIGDGQLVPCTVEGGTFVSAFGTGSCEGTDGDGRLFLRPEDLEQLSEGRDGGVPATIVGRRFYGHDVLDRVRLDSGEEIEVRCLSSTVLPVESVVRIALRRRLYRVFS